MIMTNRLPKEYTEVEYIQNSGTQYIDTEFTPNYDKSIKIEIVTAPTVAGRRYCLMSNYSSSNHLSLELNTSNKGRAYWKNGQVDKLLGTMSTSDKNTFIFEYDATNKQYNFNVNDETANGNMNATGVSGTSLLMFVDREKRFSTFSTPLKIYSIRIWEDDSLVRNFIPCIRKSDNEVGMYDLVNEMFYANEGTGTFIAGNIVQAKIKKIKIKINETIKNIYYITTKVNNVMVKVFNALSVRDTGENITLDGTANLKFIQPPLPKGNSNQDTLPTGYTQLDYIESTGTQHIDSGITPDETLEFDITFNTSNTFTTSSGYGCIFGSRQSSGVNDLQLTTYIGEANPTWGGTFRHGSGGGNNAYLANNTKINVKLQGSKYYVNGEEKQTITINASNSYNIYIFTLNQSNSAVQHGSLKLYSFKLYKNGSLVRNFVPCKNASNEVGLYDLVSETFFGNIGSGTFTAGDVSTETLPNPDFEVPIQNVTGDVEVLVQNKNLFDYEFISDYSNVTSSTLKFVEVKGLKPNTTYFISNYDTSKANQVNIYSMGYEPNTVHGQQIMLKNNSWYYANGKSFTTTETGKWYIGLYNPTTQEKFEEAIKVFENAQIEENTTATTYTPHQEQTLPLTLENIELCKIGDYQDYFYKENSKWYLYKAIEKTVIPTGVDIYGLNLTGYTLPKVEISKGLLGMIRNYNYNVCLSNKWHKTTYSNPSNFGITTEAGLNNLWFFIEGITTIEDARQYIEGSTFYSVQATPTSTEITDTTLIEQLEAISSATSYGEQTNISGTSDESNPLFSVEAYQRN